MTTRGMEDHLKQIHRLSEAQGYTRVTDVAEALSVNPSAASKMARRLAEAGYVEYEKYGWIFLTPQGERIGGQLQERKQTLERFLSRIGVPEQRVETESANLEHHFSWETLGLIREFVEKTEEHRKE